MKYIAIIALILALLIVGAATMTGAFNEWIYDIRKADDRTNYETIKKVEDTCRAMIASYNTDKLTYEQYITSDNDEKVGWAEQAKMRANKTASTYNNYILENSFLWEDNIPKDIAHELEYIGVD
jgi:hypothetical protein